MNRYDELCEFRLATLKAVEEIMAFIKKYWSATHILANDREFFLSESQNGDQVNFLLAKNKQSDRLEAIMGFFCYVKEPQPGNAAFSGGMLRTHPNSEIPFLGVEMIRRFYAIQQPKVYLGNGSNPITALPLQKRILKHYTGRLRHFYRLADKEIYNIAVIAQKKIPEITAKLQQELLPYPTAEEMYKVFDEAAFKKCLPYKDRWYIEKRYFNHPVYQYQLYGIGTGTVLVGREVSVKDTTIFRIVDVLGDCQGLGQAGHGLSKLMAQKGYEYIDIYARGIDEMIFIQAGFVERTEEDGNIIPNYFEPFVQKNVEIYYHTDSETAVIFKADGDQDRPNYR